ncbi:MAG TPA: glycosyltransferase family 4 protein [Chloroflexota bacterium]
MPRLSPHNAEFAIVSFEGPDEYSRAGGLAVRVRDLAETLAGQGFRTHLFFIGDPNLASVEEQGNLILHRWSQWISAYHPGGVYDGESGKSQDLTASLPPVLVEEVIRPAAQASRRTIVMGEDWQTVDAMIRLGQLVAGAGLRDVTIPVWTANNVFRFTVIDWGLLTAAAHAMTVSRYMKHEMRLFGINPLVAPNGIAPSAVVDVAPEHSDQLRKAIGADLALFKIGRFTPDKRWTMALDAVALLNQRGVRSRIVIRGDRSPYGQDVLARAANQGLRIVDLTERFTDVPGLAAGLSAHPEADVLNLVSFLPDSLLPAMYASVDAVLANSGHEPFGLVGLEVMGAGGLAFVGSTGEEYAEPEHNAVVLDTDDPLEIVVQLLRLREDTGMVTRLKRRAKETARAWTWPAVLPELLTKLEYVALARGVEIST